MHFSVLVLSENGQDAEELLLPYMENCCDEPPMEYMEFYEDEDCDVDAETGLRGYWQNPNAKWDWYEMGGRFAGALKAARGERGAINCEYPAGRYDRARVGDCDFTPDAAIAELAKDYWERIVEGMGSVEDRPICPYSPELLIEVYGTKERFIDLNSRFSVTAVVTPDGEWFEQPHMGFLGLSDKANDEAVRWEEEFQGRFLEGADPDWTATVFDCHI